MSTSYVQVICTNGHYAEHDTSVQVRSCPTCFASPGWTNIVTSSQDVVTVETLARVLSVVDDVYALPTTDQVVELMRLRGRR